MAFSVNISSQENIVPITPEQKLPLDQDLDPPGALRANVMLGLTAGSTVEATASVSTVGEALKGNLAAVHHRHNDPGCNAAKEETLEATQDFVLAMADDDLAILAEAALSQPTRSRQQDATFLIQAVQISATGFIIANLVLNLADPTGLACATYHSAVEKRQEDVMEKTAAWRGVASQDTICSVIWSCNGRQYRT